MKMDVSSMKLDQIEDLMMRLERVGGDARFRKIGERLELLV